MTWNVIRSDFDFCSIKKKVEKNDRKSQAGSVASSVQCFVYCTYTPKSKGCPPHNVPAVRLTVSPPTGASTGATGGASSTMSMSTSVAVAGRSGASDQSRP